MYDGLRVAVSGAFDDLSADMMEVGKYKALLTLLMCTCFNELRGEIGDERLKSLLRKLEADLSRIDDFGVIKTNVH